MIKSVVTKAQGRTIEFFAMSKSDEKNPNSSVMILRSRRGERVKTRFRVRNFISTNLFYTCGTYHFVTASGLETRNRLLDSDEYSCSNSNLSTAYESVKFPVSSSVIFTSLFYIYKMGCKCLFNLGQIIAF